MPQRNSRLPIPQGGPGTGKFAETQIGTAASSISGNVQTNSSFAPVGATQYAYFGGLFKTTYSGAGGVTGVGHYGGVLGWAVNNSPGVTSSLVVGAEGKIDNNAGTITDARCVEAQLSANPAGQTVTTLRGVNSEVTANDGTIGTFYGYYAGGNNNTGTISTYTGFAVTRPDGTVSAINGLLIPDMTASGGGTTVGISSGLVAGANKYFIFHSGAASSYHGGQWQIGGPLLRPAPTTKTANYTVTAADSHLIMNGAGSLTLTLENAVTFPGRELYVRTIAAQTVVSASSNVVPMVGGAAGTAILAATAGKWALLVSDGTNWQVMAGN